MCLDQCCSPSFPPQPRLVRGGYLSKDPLCVLQVGRLRRGGGGGVQQPVPTVVLLEATSLHGSPAFGHILKYTIHCYKSCYRILIRISSISLYFCTH